MQLKIWPDALQLSFRMRLLAFNPHQPVFCASLGGLRPAHPMPALTSLPVPTGNFWCTGLVCRQYKICTGLISLCYNAVNMQYQPCFANNNNSDNNDPRIVGRSFAG